MQIFNHKIKMDLREQCTKFRVRLEPIATELGYSLPYVSMVVRGKRLNGKILTAVHNALENKKKEYREMVA